MAIKSVFKISTLGYILDTKISEMKWPQIYDREQDYKFRPRYNFMNSCQK